MTLWQQYHLAESVTDALQAAAQAAGEARFIAGGSDLLLDLQQGRTPPLHTLVDVSHIPELCALELRDGSLFIGAAAAIQHITSNPLVQQHTPALFEAGSLIGGPQVRNVATLGGNVGHALPAADGAIALTALAAQAEIASLEGRRQLPMRKLFVAPGQSALEKGQLLVGFHLPLRQPGEASAFQRVMRPQGVAIAILNMAAWVRLHEGVLAEVRLAVGPAGPVPFRAVATEAVLSGRNLTDETWEMATQALLQEAQFRTSPHRATRQYRQRLAGELLRQTLTVAVQRAETWR